MELLEVVVLFGGVREREKEGGVRENGGREVEERIERERGSRSKIDRREKKRRKKNLLLHERVALVGDVHQLGPGLALCDHGLEGGC